MVLALDTGAKTPSSNTGLKCQNDSETPENSLVTVKCDWVQFSIPVTSHIDAKYYLDYLSGMSSDEWTVRPGQGCFIGIQWMNSADSVRGGKAAWNLPGEYEGANGQLWVSLPGQVCSSAGNERLNRIMRLVLRHDGHVTRFDVCIDDYGKTIEPQKMIDAFDEGNIAHIGMIDPRFPRHRGQEEIGWTVYLGSAKSDKRLRYYNKSVQSDGEVDSYRLEAQFRGVRANEAVRNWLEIGIEDVELQAQYLAGIVTGCVDFIDRSNGKRLSRCERLEWWESFIKKVGVSIRLALPKVVNTIHKTLNWIQQQVETSLAMVAEYFGSEDETIRYLGERIDRGRIRMTDRHRRILRNAT